MNLPGLVPRVRHHQEEVPDSGVGKTSCLWTSWSSEVAPGWGLPSGYFGGGASSHHEPSFTYLPLRLLGVLAGVSFPLSTHHCLAAFAEIMLPALGSTQACQLWPPPTNFHKILYPGHWMMELLVYPPSNLPANNWTSLVHLPNPLHPSPNP